LDTPYILLHKYTTKIFGLLVSLPETFQNNAELYYTNTCQTQGQTQVREHFVQRWKSLTSVSYIR
jgi:hypothetical protein